MDLSSISKPQDYTIYTNLQGLEELKRQAREDQRAALKPVAQQFEALFLEQILKQSRQVKLDDGWLEGSHIDTYYDMYDKQLAQDLSAKGSLGFADQIVEQLTSDIPNLDDGKTEAWLAQQQQRIEQRLAPSTEQALKLRSLE
jgi:flagellar protein FlgJ